MADDRSEWVRRWAVGELCRAHVRELAADVRAMPGVELVVIKGLHISSLSGAGERAMHDVDVVVSSGSFAAVVRHVVRSGRFRIVCDDWSTKTLEHRDGGPFVDLHRFPLPPLMGSMPAVALLRRAAPAPDLGENVHYPDPADAGVIALVNVYKDVFGTFGPYHLESDLDALAAAGLTPESLASRLREYRVRRMGIVTLTDLARRDGRHRPWLGACGPTRREEWAARTIEGLMRTAAPAGQNVALLAARLGGDRLVDIATSGVLGGARLLRDGGRALRGVRGPRAH